MILPESTRRRLPRIKAGLLQGKTSEQIAIECGVQRLTIERDKQKWRESGDLEDWIREEAIRLHYIVVKKKPIEAYREIMRLLGKTITRKAELKTTKEIKVEEKHVSIVADYTKAIESAAYRDIQALRARKQVDTKKPQTTTT